MRFVTEITKENIHCCKKIMELSELRHLDGIIGNFGVTETDYIAAITGNNKEDYLDSLKEQRAEPLSQAVYSNVKPFVEHQQFFFETLWNKAIPAKQRFKEIEEGAKREFVETVRDPYEIQKIGFDLIKKAEDEILIVFSTANAFRRQEKAGALELLKEAATLRGVKVRILVPIDNNNNTVSERIEQMKNVGIDIRTIKQAFQNKLTMLVIDQSLCLTVELKDDTKDETSEEEAIGLATYSNSEATVFNYVSIFENLWIQTQMHKREQEEAAS